MTDRVQGLLEANSRLVLKGRDLKRMLEKSRDQFKFYGEQHRAKNTPDADIKAAVNEGLVIEIQTLLDSYHIVEAESTITA